MLLKKTAAGFWQQALYNTKIFIISRQAKAFIASFISRPGNGATLNPERKCSKTCVLTIRSFFRKVMNSLYKLSNNLIIINMIVLVKCWCQYLKFIYHAICILWNHSKANVLKNCAKILCIFDLCIYIFYDMYSFAFANSYRRRRYGECRIFLVVYIYYIIYYMLSNCCTELKQYK